MRHRLASLGGFGVATVGLVLAMSAPNHAVNTTPAYVPTHPFELALPAVLIANIWQVLGFYMIILLAGLQNIPSSVYEAAAIDGASPWQTFYRITLPLLRPAIFLAFVVGIMTSFTSFDLVYVMTQGGPSHSSELLVTYIYKTAFELSKLDYAAALTVVQFLLLVTLTWLGNRLSGGDAGAVERD